MLRIFAIFLVEGVAEDFLSGARFEISKWGKAERSVEQSINESFPRSAYPDGFWSNLAYTHGQIPNITREGLVAWVKDELLGGESPFSSTDGEVPMPMMKDGSGAGLDEVQFFGYTRRQVCYIVAKSLIGSDTVKFPNALKAFLDRQGPGGCRARSGGFGRSFWTLLASCYADPTVGRGQGPLIVVSRGSENVAKEETLQDASNGLLLSAAKLKVCRYDDGSTDSPLPGIAPVDPSRCRGKRSGQSGIDFMTSNGDVSSGGQALQILTQRFLGGHLFGVDCAFGGGQSEHVAFVMPEVAALSFFLSHADGSAEPEIRTPVWVLGARPLFELKDATIWSTPDPKPFQDVPFESDLVEVQIRDRRVKVSNLKPVVAFSAETENILQATLSWDETKLARTNRLVKQRNVKKDSSLSFGHKVQMYYRGMSLTNYAPEVGVMLKTVVKSVGVGPWGAGLSFGDSTLGFLAAWIGHAAAAGSWDGALPDFEYYIYSSFVENPSNQCLVLSRGLCQKCISECNQRQSNPKMFWLPQRAFLHGNENNPCITGKWHECSINGIEHLHWNFRDRSAGHLWQMVAYAIWKNRDSKAERSITDELMELVASQVTGELDPIFPKKDIYT